METNTNVLKKTATIVESHPYAVLAIMGSLILLVVIMVIWHFFMSCPTKKKTDDRPLNDDEFDKIIESINTKQRDHI